MGNTNIPLRTYAIRWVVVCLAVVIGTVVAPTGAYAKAGEPAGQPAASATMLASSGCGRICDDKNPATYWAYVDGGYYICADDAFTARVEDYFNYGGPIVELRYSPRCRTAWTRINNDNFTVEINSYYLNGTFRTNAWGFAGAYYSNMLDDANLLAEACASTGPTSYCTTRY